MNKSVDWIEKLKKRWGIYSTFQVVVILIVFALTGFSTLFLENLVIDLLQINEGGKWWIAALVFVFITLPIYNSVLLVYGFVFGQFKFFWNFEKLFFGRILKLIGIKK